ncbi:hypothetical protein A0H81_10949 [Grifola frondosa]|uniref:Uncharacterized protein n=1 Tax=Grifola frondosa TaxID=5627 RepID=A0A1C7LXD8_GRIFR|nr:hypothetical protein A0H81_10949 [Grifola frondosa]
MLRLPAIRRTPLLFRRPLSTATSVSARLPRPILANTRILVPATPSLFHKQLIVRGAASSVSGRPGSQTLPDAAENIREELGNSSVDLAKAIAAGNVFSDNVEPTQQTFLGITNSVAHAVPSLTTIFLAQQAGVAATGLATNLDPGVAITLLDQALNFQVTYGAVMLSFLGALHWGFEFAGYGGHQGYPRLFLGAAPVVFGWSTLALAPMESLIAQWIGFTALWWADLRATSAGWTPAWYSQYRFYLSILVGTCIIGSLAATSYWGPVGGHGFISHDLDMIRAQRKQKQPEREGFVRGDVEALPAGRNADSYVMVKRKKHPEGEQH